MAVVTVRVIRVYEVEVEADYGDTPGGLTAEGQALVTDATPYVETAAILPESS